MRKSLNGILKSKSLVFECSNFWNNADTRQKKTGAPGPRRQTTTDDTYETENTNTGQNEPTLLALTFPTSYWALASDFLFAYLRLRPPNDTPARPPSSYIAYIKPYGYM